MFQLLEIKKTFVTEFSDFDFDEAHRRSLFTITSTTLPPTRQPRQIIRIVKLHFQKMLIFSKKEIQNKHISYFAGR